VLSYATIFNFGFEILILAGAKMDFIYYSIELRETTTNYDLFKGIIKLINLGANIHSMID
jgi:hypothetical protein